MSHILVNCGIIFIHGAHSREMTAALLHNAYTVSQKTTLMLHTIIMTHEGILMIFGTYVTKKISN